ncbi:hypothetical protein M0Q50_09900 [bacterium]|jgi:hypothetical protein|nr:hypothetical protein [bacterium]
MKRILLIIALFLSITVNAQKDNSLKNEYFYGTNTNIVRLSIYKSYQKINIQSPTMYINIFPDSISKENGIFHVEGVDEKNNYYIIEYNKDFFILMNNNEILSLSYINRNKLK